jgi:hypothetical protein
MKAKRKNLHTGNQNKTLPAAAPDTRQSQSHAALQHRRNVERAKRWVDENKL